MLEHHLRNALAAAWGRVSPPSPVSTDELRQRLSSGTIKKILLIRPHQGIGDLLLATPVFQALKKASPEIALHFLGSPHNVIAVRDNPRVSKIWIYNKNAMRFPQQAWEFFRGLRAQRFDLALVLFSNAPSFTSYLIARLSGATTVGSIDTQRFYGGTNWSQWLTDWKAPAPTPVDPEYLKFFRLVEPLVDLPCPPPEFHFPASLNVWADDQWKKLGLRKENPPIAFFLGGNSKRPDRLWTAAAWAHLAKLLQGHGTFPMVAVCPPPGLLGGGGVPEISLYPEFRSLFGAHIPVFDERGLPQAAAFLKPVKLFICPDGGLFHIAAAAGVCTLGLFFNSDPALWCPPIDTVTCLRAPDGRPDRLTPETVFAAINS